MTTSQADLKPILEFAEATAREAGERLMEAYQGAVSISYKGEIDLVTQADRDSEALIVSAIRQQYPTHGILAEESGEITVDAPEKSGLIWLIDPLDGTTNFAHRFPVFCVSMALRDAHDILLGVIYDPTRDECFTAQRGQGAWLNGEPIAVSEVVELKRALIATGFPYDAHVAEDNNINAFSVFIRRAQAIRRPGSAALDLAYVACGRFDGYWEMRLHPWDIAAGLLTVREAGGHVSDYEGGVDTSAMILGRKLVATNGRFHEAMIETLREVYGPAA